MTLAPDTRLGVYQIVSPLGAGGMGEVYRARDTKLGRDVAIKVLPSSFAADPDRLARFEREARLLASLNHPNIGAIYGVEEAAGFTALVLELVEGETLAARLARKPSAVSPQPLTGLPLAEALSIARQIADALDAAHERGIVHRDLKPANIVLTPDGVVKVLDFGLAKGAGGAGGSGLDENLTHSPTVIGPTLDGVLLGTAPYMSPEQARGKAVDKRTDIWAFGCVLFEMLTGRRAFPGETTSDTIAAILEREPEWTRLPSATPPTVSRLLHRCLEKDPKRRLRDIADARVELDDTSAAKPVPTDAGGPRSSRREQTLWVAVAVMSAAIAGLTAWSVRVLRPGVTPPRITRAVRLTDTPVQEFGPAISPDGKWVAYYSDVRGVADVWVRFIEGGAISNLTASLGLDLQVRASIGGVDISPDGTLIAFTARQTSDTTPSFSTWVISAPLGGQPRKLLTGLQGMRWSPDGTRLVAMRPGAMLGDSLVVGDADGSRQQIIVPLSSGRHIHWPAWSRDGRSIYFICTFMTGQDEPTDLCRVPAEGGPVEPVVTTARRAMYPAPMPDGSVIFAANPQTIDLGLWWRPASGGESYPLTSGVGEYAETSLR